MKIQTVAKHLFRSRLHEGLEKVGLSPLSLAMFIMLAMAPVLIKDEYMLRLGVVSLMFGTMAMGFDLSAGFISVANWGYSGLMGLGAYVSALMLINLGISPWIGIFIGAFAASLLGLLIGILTLRMSGMFAGILAWFIGLTLMALAAGLQPLTRGSLGLNVPLLFDTAWSSPYFYTMLTICIITFISLRLIVRSHLGLAFISIGQDVEAARASGVSPLKYKVINFTISCFIAGMCGGFYAHFIGILTPNLMSTRLCLEILVIAYIGGRGSIWGPLFAAFLIVPTFEALNHLFEVKYIIYGLVLILVMIIYPKGLSGLWDSLMRFCKTKIFKEREIM